MHSYTIVTLISWSLGIGLTAFPEPDNGRKTVSDSVIAQYRGAVERITKATMESNDAYAKLEHLCINIGTRLSGSPGLEQAIDWTLEAMRKDGAQNVRREKVMVPHWVRGRESATMLEPRVQALQMLGLGQSIGTTREGITAPVVVVADEKELEEVGEGASGKIVLFNNPMPEYHPEHGAGYGSAVRFRHKGAQLAAGHGAVACLVRSVTATSLGTPHTGAMSYGEAKVQIPAAAIAIEDADTIARMQKLGTPVVVNLRMDAKNLPDAESANAVGELRGSTHPEEVVVIGGHIDAWDVGHGAHDDGGGCVIAMEVINVLRKLDMIPKRTIRVVLWTNEENGLRGGKTYAKDHAHELDNHVAAIESDSGVFAPRGYSVQCKDKDRQSLAAEQMTEILSLFPDTLGPLSVKTGYSGADVSPMKDGGVILMGHRVEGSTYFNFHHTHADTIDKVDPEQLSQNVAVLASVAYILADMPHRIGEKP